MDFGPVDRITADAIGEPGDRTFYLQASTGDQVISIVVEKQQVQLLAASILELLATLELETGTGPSDEELAIEEPVEPRFRAGKLSIGFDEDRDMFLLEVEEFQPEARGRRPAVAARGRAGGRAVLGHTRADVRMFALRGVGGRPRPADLPVLRQPARPGRARVSRDERALVTGLSDPAVPPAMATGELEHPRPAPPLLELHVPRARRRTGNDAVLAVYKPRRGEIPLWDFPEGTLCQREVAAYLVARELGWPNVPPTILRDGPEGVGSVQRFVPFDPEAHYFTLEPERADDFRRVALVRRGREQRRPQGRPLPPRARTARSG